jgi:hypothetical protein
MYGSCALLHHAWSKAAHNTAQKAQHNAAQSTAVALCAAAAAAVMTHWMSRRCVITKQVAAVARDICC